MERKKPPRALAVSLDEALKRAFLLQARLGKSASHLEAVVQALGYKGANNGAALTMLGALKEYGLLKRSTEGQWQLTDVIERYQQAATQPHLRKQLLQDCLIGVPAFAPLLKKYPQGLPEDDALRNELSDLDISPVLLVGVLNTLKKSLAFIHSLPETIEAPQLAAIPAIAPITVAEEDRIPVRLSGGRKAWLVIPSPFYTADKQRLKAQIDLLMCEDE
jgi:hypothetical protein